MATNKLELYLQAEQDLLSELQKVRELIIVNGGTPASQKSQKQSDEPVREVPKQVKREKQQAVGVKRGSRTWGEYVLFILEELGGQAKTHQVIDYATKAHPKDSKTASDAVRGQLSRLYRDKIISATPAGATKKDGYIFSLKKNEEKRDLFAA